MKRLFLLFNTRDYCSALTLMEYFDLQFLHNLQTTRIHKNLYLYMKTKNQLPCQYEVLVNANK